MSVDSPNHWFAQLQRQASDRYPTLPTPTRRDETWRFASLKHLADLDAFSPASPVSASQVEQILASVPRLANAIARLVFLNGDLVQQEGTLPEGATLLPLLEAVESKPEIFQEYFMAHDLTLGSAKYSALHQSKTRSGVFLHLTDGIELSAPIEVIHLVTGDHVAIYPHTLLVAEKNAKASVFERHLSVSDDAAPHLVLGVTDLVANEGSHLTYLVEQDLNQASKDLHLTSAVVGKDADATLCLLNLGASWVRNESISKLNGTGANSVMLSANVASGQQEIDQRTYQDHASPNTTSDLLYKNVLNDEARTIFSGLIYVQEGAHHTDAYQKCRSLLLSDQADANAMPGLEINADQVKCSHGATASPIEDEDLFYLQARGIALPQARELIAKGFASEVFDRLQDATLQEEARQAVARAFERLHQPEAASVV